MAQKYNPLLKFGFQETGGGGGEAEQIAALQYAVTELQNALNALKSNKITKVTAAAQLSDIEIGEIFEWQAESQTVDGVDYVNGYFYKKSQSGQVVTIPADQPCFNYNSTSLYARGTIDFHDYSLTYDDYYVAGELQPENSNLTSIDCRTFGNGRYYALFVESSLTCVGSIVFDTYDLVSIGVTRCFYDENNRYALTLELENGISVAAYSGSFGRLSVIWDCYSENGNHIAVLPWSLVGSQKYLLADYSISDNTVTISDWTLFGATESTTAEPITIDTTVVTYSRTDTQPNNSYTLPTAAANVLGGVKVGSGLSIDANGVLSLSSGFINLDCSYGSNIDGEQSALFAFLIKPNIVFLYGSLKPSADIVIGTNLFSLSVSDVPVNLLGCICLFHETKGYYVGNAVCEGSSNSVGFASISGDSFPVTAGAFTVCGYLFVVS